MNKREKILVFFAFGTFIYGIYHFGYSSLNLNIKKFLLSYGGKDKISVLNSSSSLPSKKIFKIEGEINNKSNPLELSKNKLYILKHANMVPEKDPFIKKRTFSKIAALSNKTKSIDINKLIKSFQYIGFLSIGNTKMAVINGKEYKLGDEIEDSGFVVNKIQPYTVILKYGVKLIPIHISEKTNKI